MSDEEPKRRRDSREVDFGELPELTPALRALGSARRGAGAHQLLLFQPLLEARKRAAMARTPLEAVRAFSGASLMAASDRVLDRVVGDWPDARESARRALRSELRERIAPYLKELETLDEQAAELLADNTPQVDLWRDWTAQLIRVFAAADRAWMALAPAIERIGR